MALSSTLTRWQCDNAFDHSRYEWIAMQAWLLQIVSTQ